MSDPIIQASDVSKSFKKTMALNGCDVEIPAGRIVGLLGENGAGKTTLMRTLAGLVRPTSGTVRVFGQPAGSTAVANRIGVTIEGSAYYPWLSAHDNVAAMHRGFGRALGSERIAATLGRVGLDQSGRRRASTLSQGQRQRLAPAVAMAHEPGLFVLDEPANGLDPTGMADLRKLIVAERDRGATVLVSSHLLAELEEFCDTVVMMHRGKVVGTRDLDQDDSSLLPGRIAARGARGGAGGPARGRCQDPPGRGGLAPRRDRLGARREPDPRGRGHRAGVRLAAPLRPGGVLLRATEGGGGMIRMLSAELLKLRRPLTGVILLLAVVFAGFAAHAEQTGGVSAMQAVAEAPGELAQFEQGTITLGAGTASDPGKTISCTWGQQYPSGSVCAQEFQGLISGNDALLYQYEQTQNAAHFEQNPLGVGALAGAVLTSMLGFLLVMLLSAGHIGGEWTNRTIRTVLTGQPSRLRAIAVKAASVWLASLTLLVVVWLELIGFAWYYHANQPIPVTAGAPVIPTIGGVVVVGKAALVLAVYALVGTSLAVISRGVLGSLISGLSAGFGFLTFGYYVHNLSWLSFTRWVTAYMGSASPRMIGTNAYWVTGAQFGVKPVMDGLVGLLVVGVLCSSVGWFAFRRSDVVV